MKIVNFQDLCDNLNKIINELKYIDQQQANNSNNSNYGNNYLKNNKSNNKNESRKNKIEFINNITRYNLGTGFVCNNNNE